MILLKGLNIRHMKSLCCLLGTSPSELERLCDIAETQYCEFILKKEKKNGRKISEPYDRLKEISRNLNAMLQRIDLPDVVQGGRKGYSYITNAEKHQRKPMVLKFDIKDCFPSITNRMVYEVFEKRLGCYHDVARYLTRLTTVHGCLPQGAPSSSILAAFVLEPLSLRLKKLAEANGITYTQYIDDIAFSGQRWIVRLKPIILKIIRQSGFEVKEDKIKTLSKESEQIVTGVRVDNGLDAPKDYIKKTRLRIENLDGISREGESKFVKEIESIKGMIAFIAQFNRGAAKNLRKRLKKHSVKINVSS